MHHLAILQKANISKGDDLLNDILLGHKTIESRWYVNKIAPYGKINPNDTVYFKESGCPVKAKATVEKVLQYESLNISIINEIINNYGNLIAPHSSKQEWQNWAIQQNKKRYCVLIFLNNVQKIEPFNINKKGYGISSAWITVENIEKIKNKT